MLLWYHCSLSVEPDQTPQNLIAYSHTSRSVTLSWSFPDLFYQNGNITRHRITTTTNPSQPISVRETTYIGRETTAQINELNIYTIYTFTVSAGTAVGFGPDATIIKRTLNDSMLHHSYVYNYYVKLFLIFSVMCSSLSS